ncbi:hypothetical protein Scep_005316 [Stephania cephalantha]|uniref:Uncharacterized protein n=1 Tax=Stephania cephalantha TaxID=152367 RepID=A0AAP0KU30_9MAGN
MCIASLRRTLSASLYPFRSSSVLGLISTSIRSALDCPLNYARNYLPHLLPIYLRCVVYLDSDLLLSFAGNIAPVDHRWNQDGLGGDNFRGLSLGFASRQSPPALEWEGKPWASPSPQMFWSLSSLSPKSIDQKVPPHPLSRAKSSTGFIEFGFGLFVVPPLSGESGFGSIGHYAIVVGRVLGEFDFGFFDHSLPVVFWDQ